jgi:RNA-directed DNA polymerase
MKKRKEHTLIDKVYSWRNLYESWEKVKANRGAHGIDEVSIREFERNRDYHIAELHYLLKTKRYKPKPVRRVFIPKPDGSQRPLGIPTIRDRIVQQALKNVLEPIFEPTFEDCSYGFRPGRNCHQAIEKIQEYIEEGNGYVIDADIESYFDTIDHETLIDMIAERIADGRVLRMIRDMLRAGVLYGDIFEETTEGTPQGGVISPLLANIYLHHFDQRMTEKGYKIVRYADDFIIMCRTRNEVSNARLAMHRVLEKQLKLTIHPTKTKVKRVEQGIAFLGFVICAVCLLPQREKVEKLKEMVRKATRRQQPIKVTELIKRLNRVIMGWGHYFKIGNVKSLFRRLDQWIRMRVRSFIKKRKSRNHNWQIPNKHLSNMGLKTLISIAS